MSIKSIFIELELASRKKRKATKVDIRVAYLNTEIDDGEEVLIRLTAKLTKILVEQMKELKPYVYQKGRTVVKVVKALYGLVLWFETLYEFLVNLGFESYPVRKCVLNMDREGRGLTLILYMDNILIFWKNDGDSKWSVQRMREQFDSLTKETCR